MIGSEPGLTRRCYSGNGRFRQKGSTTERGMSLGSDRNSRLRPGSDPRDRLKPTNDTPVDKDLKSWTVDPTGLSQLSGVLLGPPTTGKGTGTRWVSLRNRGLRTDPDRTSLVLSLRR